MALTTLAMVHTALGIPQSDATQDAFLTQLIGGGSRAIRTHVGDEYLYGCIGPVPVSNPAAITCPQHDLESGKSITIAGSSFAGLNGPQTVTVTGPDTFTVPVNVTTADTTGLGVFCRSYTEFYSGNGTSKLLLDHTPVQSITSVYEDEAGYFGEPAGAFASTTLLTAGTDYVLKRDEASESNVSNSGIVLRLNQLWKRPTARVQGLLTSAAGDAMGNIKVAYVAGYLRLLGDVALAANQFVAMLARSAADGTPMQREKYDYYEYQMLEPDKEAKALNSVKHLLRSYKHWTW